MKNILKQKYRKRKKYNSYIDDEEEKVNIKSNKREKRKKQFIPKPKYFYILFSIILIFFLLLFLFFKLKNKSNNKNNKNDIITLPERNLTGKILPREEAIESAISYLRKCSNGILINNKTLTEIQNPLISIVIPCYFCKDYIKKALRSIQNQNFNEIEIIIVNDDLDNSTITILNSLKEEDPRIKLILNNKRMGILYTRSMGVLLSKGIYVTTLDQDDFFLDYDVFDYLYHVAFYEKIDIVVFKILEGYGYDDKNKFRDNNNNKKRTNLTIYQPILSCHTLADNGTFRSDDIYIWAKFFKAMVYKSSINLLGKERYSTFMEWEEDVIMTFLTVNMAESYKFIDKYGYFHLLHGGTPTTRLPGWKKNYYRLIKVEIFFDFCKKECKLAPVLELIEMRGDFQPELDAENRMYLERLIKKIFEAKDIEIKYKEDIKKLYRNYFPNLGNFSENINFTEIS